MRLFDEARGDSTGAVLGQCDMPVWPDSAENCVDSTGAVL